MNWQSSRREIAGLEPRHQPGERHLGRVGRAAEHAFAEEGADRASRHRARRPAGRLPTLRPSGRGRRRGAPCIARSISALIQVSSRSAQAAMTPAKSRSRVTVKRPERSVRRSERERWNRSSGMIARWLGSTQNSSLGVAAVGHRENAGGIALEQESGVEAHVRSRAAGRRRSEDFAHDVLRAAQANALVGLDDRPVDQDRVLRPSRRALRRR